MSDELTHFIVRNPSKVPPSDPNREPSEAFKFVRELNDHILEYQFSVARWVMASLLLINGGGIAALMNIADKHPSVASAGTWFIGGIISAMLSGIFVWFNCVCIGEAATDRLDWTNLDLIDPPSADKWDSRAMWFAALAILSAFASLVAFGYGARVAKSAIANEVAVASPSAPKAPDKRN